jgi:hypothetical protein
MKRAAVPMGDDVFAILVISNTRYVVARKRLMRELATTSEARSLLV